ncbi:hypothetical protein UFOVP708_51 [uncultured Caudovirales phage]|uniref:Uncharacterized protein n=1 Tax=uncultured Caudovirales phage TaxID=2100421 RepID=A0A6J5NV42_9CAUD|nr:hypothetical protein UFOVP708_51 [uncultured Caudovirales phage]
MPRTTGSTAAVAGAEQAAAHADRKNPEPLWTDRAYEHFMAVALRGRPFQTEEVRAAAERAGLPKPPDSRAWGQVALRAIRAGRIRRVGYAPVTQAQSHAGPKSVWQINTTTTTSE